MASSVRGLGARQTPQIAGDLAPVIVAIDLDSIPRIGFMRHKTRGSCECAHPHALNFDRLNEPNGLNFGTTWKTGVVLSAVVPLPESAG